MNDSWQSHSRRKLPRRRLLAGGAAAAASLAAPYGFSRRAAAAGAADNTVRVLGVSTVALPDWQAFDEETGLEMQFTGVRSDPGVYVRQVVAQQAGNRYDIFMFVGGIEDRLGPVGYFRPIDPERLTMWPAVSRDLRESPLLWGPDGVQYGVPIVFNADSFGYHRGALGGGPFSWAVVFDNDDMLDNVALEDSWLTSLPNAALYLKGQGASIDDPADMTPEEVVQVVDFLIERKQAGQFRRLWKRFDQSVTLLASRDVLVAQCWEPAVIEARRLGADVAYATVIEGYSKWMIGAYLPAQANGDRLSRAYLALDWFLGGQYGALMAIGQGYDTANPQAALDYARNRAMDEATVAAIETNIVEVRDKMSLPLYWQNPAPRHASTIDTEWQRFRDA